MLEKVVLEIERIVVANDREVNRRIKRRSLGIYYTPPNAARLLASWAIRDPGDLVLEPSFGGCALLAAAIEAFKELGVDKPSSQLVGYDVDPVAFEHLVSLGIKRDTGSFQQKDFLQSAPRAIRVTAVLANPPFVSYHRMSREQRCAVLDWRNRHDAPINQRASLWAYFVLHSMEQLEDGGRMAFVVPSAMRSADYAKPLIQTLRRHFSSVDLLHVREQLFLQEGADERVSLLLADGYSRVGRREQQACERVTCMLLKISALTSRVASRCRNRSISSRKPTTCL